MEVNKQAEVRPTTCDMISLLSGDCDDFTFHPAQNAPEYEQFLALQIGAASDVPVEQIILLSGRLDLLAECIMNGSSGAWHKDDVIRRILRERCALMILPSQVAANEELPQKQTMSCVPGRRRAAGRVPCRQITSLRAEQE